MAFADARTADVAATGDAWRARWPPVAWAFAQAVRRAAAISAAVRRTVEPRHAHTIEVRPNLPPSRLLGAAAASSDDQTQAHGAAARQDSSRQRSRAALSTFPRRDEISCAGRLRVQPLRRNSISLSPPFRYSADHATRRRYSAVCLNPKTPAFGLPKLGSSGRTTVMIRFLSSSSLEGKRIRPNNSAFNCRIIRPTSR